MGGLDQGQTGEVASIGLSRLGMGLGERADDRKMRPAWSSSVRASVTTACDSISNPDPKVYPTVINRGPEMGTSSVAVESEPKFLGILTRERAQAEERSGVCPVEQLILIALGRVG